MISFEKEVLQASYDKPVLVDFWAAWCGPCRMLGPVLEQLAEEQSDRWTLVKVDTEAHQELAMQYDIMSIPAVKLFHNGEVIGEFVGALPRNSIMRWLDAHLPSEEKTKLKEARDMFPNIPDRAALNTFEELFRENPEQAGFAMEWLKHAAFYEPEEAMQVMERIGLINQNVVLAEDLQVIRDWMQTSEEPGAHISEKLIAAREQILGGHHEESIQTIINSLLIDKNYLDGLPRKIGVALFRLWGIDHPLTRKHRKIFDMYLY